MIPFDKVPVPGRTETVNRPVAAGTNPTEGVVVLYHLREPGEEELRLTFLDQVGERLSALGLAPDVLAALLDLEGLRRQPGRASALLRTWIASSPRATANGSASAAATRSGCAPAGARS